ncbi:unnamed protein product [Trifolium pratense]|uniref:Uncharacterized protein n=1 Tax=Trifolium pratense TaxID=57577 RepID=A0ACB0KLH4_TRIPR|nr:unnamed protein product [Trifolium pratense]
MARGGHNNTAGGSTTVLVQDPSNNPGDVYYVHPSDGPTTVAVKPVLNHSNYQAWARSMKRALGGKNKLDFVDGTIEVPGEFEPNFKAWNRCNMLIHSWIMNSVDESIAQSIVFLDNAIDVWNELKERFSQGDYIRISELQCEIYSMKQDSRSVSEFFTALKSLWEELESYFPTPVCSCPMCCICNTGVRNAKHQHEVTRSIHFLTGLNDNFDSVRAQILLMHPLPAINRIFSMVIQQERHYNSIHCDESKVLVNASDSRKPQGRGRGYSAGASSSGSGNRSNSYGAKNKECSFCANNVSQEEREDVGDNQGARISDFGFTKEQCSQLLHLLQSSQSGNQGSSSNAGNQGSSSTQVNIASGHVTSVLCCLLHKSAS